MKIILRDARGFEVSLNKLLTDSCYVISLRTVTRGTFTVVLSLPLWFIAQRKVALPTPTLNSKFYDNHAS